ncbi:hypothetical protein NA57DRAFT_43174 [Rhizodiscina lignyota]|uniref:HNH domain-containing protein n=1 Tax=Rhizodiscina lignyota TaxID=1504668 RepID=A0A9P4IBU3_9PEZI|nr:hypothetical protein NA57DRAFT_43174 [Rhizodiscina lignyota]
MLSPSEQSNYETFRDCLSEAIIARLSAPKKPARRRAAKGRKNGLKSKEKSQHGLKANEDGIAAEQETNDAEDLADFIDYLASEIFTSLPSDLRALTHTTFTNSADLQSIYADPLPSNTLDNLIGSLPPSVADSLASYLHPSTASSVEDPTFTSAFLSPVFTVYISISATPPPPPSSTRPETNECEICGRTHLPLTYHHLIPRGVHGKVLKRGWHKEEDLNNVAWLCRACHSFVHKIASNEELAKDWWSVERLVERDDVRNWAAWVGRVRWRAR